MSLRRSRSPVSAWSGGFHPDYIPPAVTANTSLTILIDAWSHAMDEPHVTTQIPAVTMPDGQLMDYQTAVQFEFQQPKRNLYWHPRCGGYTFCRDEIALTYATNPGFYTHAYCVVCRSHKPINEFVWEPDGCPMAEVRGEPGLDLTLPQWWRADRGKARPAGG